MTDFLVLGFFYSLIAGSVVTLIWTITPEGSGIRGFLVQCLWLALQIGVAGLVGFAVLEGANAIGVTPYGPKWQWRAVNVAACFLAVFFASLATAAVMLLSSREKSEAGSVEPLAPELLDDDLTRDASSERLLSARKFIGRRRR